MSNHICLGWLGWCAVHGTAHGCRIELPASGRMHTGPHVCACGEVLDHKSAVRDTFTNHEGDS